MGAPEIRESERGRPPERDAGTWAPAEGALRRSVDAHVIGVVNRQVFPATIVRPIGEVNGV